MNLIQSLTLDFFDAVLWQRAVWTLIHSLWQAALIALIVALLLRRIPVQRANARYACALSGVAAITLLLPLTFAALSGWDAWTAHAKAAPPRNAQTDPAPSIIETSAPSMATSAPSISPTPALPTEPTAVAAAPSPTSSTPDASGDFSGDRGRGWTAWAALAWLFGVLIMLIRTAASLIATRTLLRTPALPGDHPLVMQAVVLAQRLGVRAPVRIAATDAISTPAVAGLIRPLILFPASTLTGLEESQLRAILAHELAHIARNDLLIALVQRIIEAILFFNPALLWLSRQLRIEREACCDALAAEVIGDPHEVARTLAQVAAATRPAASPLPVAALAMADEETPILQRIRRLIAPAEARPARIPWTTFALLVGASFVFLFSLSITAAQVGETAARLLKPEERIQQVREIAEEFSDRVIDAQAPENRVTIKGRVRTADGSPLPEDLRLVGFVSYMDGDTMTTAPYVSITQEPDGAFTATAPAGEVMLRAEARGFAPVGSDRLRPKPGGAIEGVEIIVGTGYTGTVQVTDQAGAPITGVEIQKSQQIHIWHAASQIAMTDANGIVQFDHLARSPVRLSVRHPGFAAESIEVTLDENQAYTWRLTSTERLVVALLDRSKPIPTGFAPLAGAEILHAFDNASVRINEPRAERRPQAALATTDERGRFSIDSLRQDTQYVYWVRWGENYQLLPMLSLADSPAEIIVDPPLWIEGEVRGDITRLEHRNDQPVITYHDGWGFQTQSRMSYGSGIPLQTTVDPETRRFRIGPLVARTDTSITAGPVKRSFNPRAYSDGRILIIDLDQAEPEYPTREVVFRFVPPPEWPPPEGEITVWANIPESNRTDRQVLSVRNGEASLTIRLPNNDQPGGVRYEPKLLPGYWFARNQIGTIEIPSGDEPFVITQPVQPAGTVHGRVLMPDGSPAGRISPSLYTIDQNAQSASAQSDSRPDGRFLVTGIPINRTFCIGVSDMSSDSERRILSDPFTFTEHTLSREITLQFVDGVDLDIRFLDPFGDPIRRIRPRLIYHSPYRHSHLGSDKSPDANGRVVWKNINPNLPGEHIIEVQPTHDTIGHRHTVDISRPVQTIQLVRGMRTTGQIIDAVTGRPIPNAHLDLHPDFTPEQQPQFPGAVPITTDAEGRFDVRNLEPITYRIQVGDVFPPEAVFAENNRTISYQGTPSTLTITGGELDQTIRVAIPPWGRFKPAPAAN